MCDMANRSVGTDEMDENIKWKEKLFSYSVHVTKELKLECYEHMNSKKELEEKADRIKKLECEIVSNKKALTDLKTSLTMKLCETEKQLKAKEEMSTKLLKEKEKLKIMMEDNHQSFMSLLEENKRLKEDVGHHKTTIEAIMNEAKQNNEKTLADISTLTEEVQDLRETLRRAKQCLKLSLQWLLRFSDELLQTGCLTQDDEGAISQYRSTYENIDKITEKECFNISSQIPNTPSNVIHISPIPSAKQDVVKVDAATSPVDFTISRTINSRTSFRDHDKRIIPISSGESDDDDLSNSMPGSESELHNSSFLRENLSSPMQVHQNISSSSDDRTTFEARDGSNYMSSNDEVADKLPLFLHSSKEEQPVGIQSGTPNAVPRITLSHTGEDPELFISFPVTPNLKEQSVNLTFEKHRVLVGYRSFRNVSVKRSASVEPEDLSGLQTPIIKRAKTPTNHPDSSSYDHLPAHQETPSRTIKTQNRSRTSSETQEMQSDSFSGNLPVHIPTHKQGHDGVKNAINICNLNQECASISPDTDSHTPRHVNTHNEEDKLMDIHRKLDMALTNLKLLRSQKSVHKSVTENLKLTLSAALHENEAKSAVDATVNFLCLQTSNPLLDFMKNEDDNVLLPLDEHCIVKAYGLVDNNALFKQLGDTIRMKLMAEINQLQLPALAALCRVFSSLHLVGKRFEAARRLCYELMKKRSDIAPYLVASIASLCPEVLQKLPANGSGLFISLAIAQLISCKPPGLGLAHWNQATTILRKYHDMHSAKAPEVIIEMIFVSIVANSKADYFSAEDVFNYTTALELLLSRFDWTWMYDNVMKKHIFPILDSYMAGVHRKNGAVGLCYRLVGVLASRGDKEGVCLKFIKETIFRTLSNKKVPQYILKLAYQAQCNLSLQSTERADAELETWFKEHGLDIEECAEIS